MTAETPVRLYDCRDAFADVFDAANEPVLTRDDLLGLPPEAWDGLDLALVEACRLLSFEHAVAGYVSARRDGDEPAAVEVSVPEAPIPPALRHAERTLDLR